MAGKSKSKAKVTKSGAKSGDEMAAQGKKKATVTSPRVRATKKAETKGSTKKKTPATGKKTASKKAASSSTRRQRPTTVKPSPEAAVPKAKTASPSTRRQRSTIGKPASKPAAAPAKTAAETTKASKSAAVPGKVTKTVELASTGEDKVFLEAELTDSAAGTNRGHVFSILNTPKLKVGSIQPDQGTPGEFVDFTPIHLAPGVSFGSLNEEDPVLYEMDGDEPKNVRKP